VAVSRLVGDGYNGYDGPSTSYSTSASLAATTGCDIYLGSFITRNINFGSSNFNVFYADSLRLSNST
jgi:hypothetical protein